MASDHEVVHLAQAHHSVVLVDKRNVGVVQCKLDLAQKVSCLLLLSFAWIIVDLLALLVNHKAETVLFVVVGLGGIGGDDDAFVLLQELLGAVEPLAVELVVPDSILINIADLGVTAVLYSHGVVIQQAQVLILKYLLWPIFALFRLLGCRLKVIICF